MIENNLKKLKIELPNAPDPVGAYVAFKKIGNLLFISGQLPISNNGKHTRAAVSTNSLPLGAAVEIDAIFEI